MDDVEALLQLKRLLVGLKATRAAAPDAVLRVRASRPRREDQRALLVDQFARGVRGADADGPRGGGKRGCDDLAPDADKAGALVDDRAAPGVNHARLGQEDDDAELFEHSQGGLVDRRHRVLREHPLRRERVAEAAIVRDPRGRGGAARLSPWRRCSVMAGSLRSQGSGAGGAKSCPPATAP